MRVNLHDIITYTWFDKYLVLHFKDIYFGFELRIMPIKFYSTAFDILQDSFLKILSTPDQFRLNLLSISKSNS